MWGESPQLSLFHGVPHALVTLRRDKLESDTAKHYTNRAPEKPLLPSCSVYLQGNGRKWGTLINQFSTLKKGHEYKRDILWDGCLKEFKHQCWSLLVIL